MLAWYADIYIVRQTLPDGDSPEALLRYPPKLVAGHALRLCAEPKSEFDRFSYQDCLKQHGIITPNEHMLFLIRGGWKPVPVTY